MKEKLIVLTFLVCIISFVLGMGYMFGKAKACTERGYTTWTPFGGCYKKVVIFEGGA